MGREDGGTRWQLTAERAGGDAAGGLGGAAEDVGDFADGSGRNLNGKRPLDGTGIWAESYQKPP